MISRPSSSVQLPRRMRSTGWRPPRGAPLILLASVTASTAPLSPRVPTQQWLQPNTCDTASTTNRSEVVLELDLPAAAHVDEPVPIRLTLVNHSDRAVQLLFGGEPVGVSGVPFDIQITRMDNGARVWQRLEGVYIPLVGNTASLRSGDSLVFVDRWRQQTNSGKGAGAGAYCVRGILEAKVQGKISGLRTIEARNKKWIASAVRRLSITRE